MWKWALIFVAAGLAILAVLLYSQSRAEQAKVSGFVEADEIRLGSLVGGRVARVLVEEGQAVEAGQIILEIQPFDQEHRRSQVQAELAGRQAGYNKLLAGFRPEEIAQAKARRDELAARLEELVNGPRKETIDAAKARFDEAKSSAAYLRSSQEKVQTAFSRNAATKEELDRANDQLASAEALVQVRQAELAELLAGTRSEDIQVAKSQLEQTEQAWILQKNGYRTEDTETAKAALDATQATLKVIDAQIGELTIKAPVDGVIEACRIKPGDLLAPNAPALTMLAKGTLYVRTYLPEDRLTIKPGVKLEVSTDSLPGKIFAGRVTFVSRKAEFTPSNVQTPEKRREQVFQMKVVLEEGLDVLRPGMPVDVWLDRQVAN